MKTAGIYGFSEATLRIFLGNRFVRDTVLAPQISKTSRLSDALRHLNALGQVNDSQCQGSCDNPNARGPVFVLSAGWGTGSTLIQRLIISSGEYLVWGEPLDEAASIQRMSESLHAIREGFPPAKQYTENYSANTLSKSWIANLIPPMETYRNAHRSFLDTWLSEKTACSSYQQWGLKEVRLNIDHARYLKWLFPNAKFVFVYRDLYSSYLSCRRKPWVSIWPDYKVSPIAAFSHHWNHLLSGFIDHHESVGGIMVRYEDIVDGKFDLNVLSEYLSINSIDKELLKKKIGGRSANRKQLILPEKLIMDSIAGPLRSRLNYRDS